ncbi:MAG: ABC transporter ATP-binding protein [Ilumatobacteraceae bacterium]|nr:ABC transporter ATP-binding protein [Ilumatobacteraceae bacterium]
MSADTGSDVSKSDEILLDVDDLNVTFPSEDGMVMAVRGVSYQVRRNEVFGIVGESGSGKSVSQMALMGLLPKTALITGTARYLGNDLIGVPDRQVRHHRGNDISMIFQDPMTSLNPVYTIGYQLGEIVRAHHRVTPKEAKMRAIDALQLVGIPQPKQRADSYPHEFSGGMRQRVMIAMAMMNDPDIIIADEPTTALDVTVQAQILETLMSVKDELGAAIILITHDLGVIAGAADRVAVMYGGRFVERGSVDEIFEIPRMPYTLGLLGSIPSLDQDEDELTPIPGTPPSLVNPPDGCPFEPRCTMAIDTCRKVEPDLEPTERPDHLAACHRWEDLVGLSDELKAFKRPAENQGAI